MTSTTRGFNEFVSVQASALASVQLVHLMSATDMSIAIPQWLASEDGSNLLTGYTEWIGAGAHADLTVGWDWGLIRDQLVLLNASEIRTNIQLLTDSGKVIPPPVAHEHLQRWIESLPWQPATFNAISQHTPQGNA